MNLHEKNHKHLVVYIFYDNLEHEYTSSVVESVDVRKTIIIHYINSDKRDGSGNVVVKNGGGSGGVSK